VRTGTVVDKDIHRTTRTQVYTQNNAVYSTHTETRHEEFLLQCSDVVVRAVALKDTGIQLTPGHVISYATLCQGQKTEGTDFLYYSHDLGLAYSINNVFDPLFPSYITKALGILFLICILAGIKLACWYIVGHLAIGTSLPFMLLAHVELVVGLLLLLVIPMSLHLRRKAKKQALRTQMFNHGIELCKAHRVELKIKV